MQQILRGAVSGGTAVDEDHLPFGVWQDGSQRRPPDAPDAPDHQGRPGEKSPGAAGGDQGVGLPVTDSLQPTGHGGVRFVPEGPGRVVLHFDDLAGRQDGNALRGLAVAELAQGTSDLCLIPGKDDFHAEILYRFQRAFHRGQGGVVAAHDVNNDCHRENLSFLFRIQRRQGFQRTLGEDGVFVPFPPDPVAQGRHYAEIDVHRLKIPH